MEGLNDGRRPNEAAPIGHEEDVFRHPSFGNARVDHQLVARKRLRVRIFGISDRRVIGITRVMRKTGLSNGLAIKGHAANGLANEDRAARATRAQDVRLIDGDDQRSTRGRGHGVVEIDVRRSTLAHEWTLERQKIGPSGIRVDVDGGIVGAKSSRSKMKISEDFVP